jgi:spore coat protein H
LRGLRFAILITLLVSMSGFAALNRIEITHDPSDEKVPGKEHVLTEPLISFNDSTPVEAAIHTRGQHCLRAPRSCYALKLDKKVVIESEFESESLKGKKFNLISMWQDEGYISSKIGYTFFSKLNLFHTAHQFTELSVNGESQGLYLIVEKPQQVLKKRFKAPFVMRRGYLNRIKVKYHSSKAPYRQKDYRRAYKSMYRGLSRYSGAELYAFLKQRMNIDNYLMWLAANTFLQNGDYADEVFFYARPGKPIYFDIMVWDMDDLFKPPHRSPLNNWWIFHRRLLRRSLLYSMEDRLDRAIAKDSFLYNKFRQKLKFLLNEVATELFIKNLFQTVDRAIAPYLTEQNLSLSKLDDREGSYTKEYIESLLVQRQAELINNRVKLLNRLDRTRAK